MHLLHPSACRRGQYRETVELLRLPVFIAALPTIPQTGQQQTRVSALCSSKLAYVLAAEPTRKSHSQAPHTTLPVRFAKARQICRGFRFSVEHAVTSAGLFLPNLASTTSALVADLPHLACR